MRSINEKKEKGKKREGRRSRELCQCFQKMAAKEKLLDESERK